MDNSRDAAWLRQFRVQGSGTLVNLGSVEAVIPLACHASYDATKPAILGLGRALNEELRLAGRTNIHVATIMPWATDTPNFAQASNYSGHRPRMPAMDDPMKVVDNILDATINPRKEVLTGWKAHGAYWSHRFAPHLTDRVAADVAHQAQFENSPPMPLSSGSVHQPSPGHWAWMVACASACGRKTRRAPWRINHQACCYHSRQHASYAASLQHPVIFTFHLRLKA